MSGIVHTMKSSKACAWFGLLRPIKADSDSHVDGDLSDLRDKIDLLCDEYSDVFAELKELPPKRPLEHRIDLIDERA